MDLILGLYIELFMINMRRLRFLKDRIGLKLCSEQNFELGFHWCDVLAGTWKVAGLDHNESIHKFQSDDLT